MDKDVFYQDARSDLKGPLEGMLVLEATTTWAGPMAGCLLADYGARVIKAEHPEGEITRRLPPHIPGESEDLSVPYETVNRNKESLSVVLSTAEGRDVFLALARKADVVIENFRPGTLASWGLGYEDIKAVKPDIIYASISGFGQFGELSDRVGYDPLAQHFSGWSSLNGDPQGQPVKAPTYLGDDLAGMHTTIGVLAALRHRDRTGEGQHLDTSLIDGILYQSTGHLTSGALGLPAQRWGNEFGVAAPVNMYACRNGNVYAGILLDSHWKRLAILIGHAELADDPRYDKLAARLQNRKDVDNLLAAWCAERSIEDVVDAFTELGLPATRVNSFADTAQIRHIHDRDMLQLTPLRNGTEAPLTGPPVKFSRTPVKVRTPAQAVGAQTRDLLREADYSDERIDELKEKKII